MTSNLGFKISLFYIWILFSRKYTNWIVQNHALTLITILSLSKVEYKRQYQLQWCLHSSVPACFFSSSNILNIINGQSPFLWIKIFPDWPFTALSDFINLIKSDDSNIRSIFIKTIQITSTGLSAQDTNALSWSLSSVVVERPQPWRLLI